MIANNKILEVSSVNYPFVLLSICLSTFIYEIYSEIFVELSYFAKKKTQGCGLVLDFFFSRFYCSGSFGYVFVCFCEFAKWFVYTSKNSNRIAVTIFTNAVIKND